MSANNIIEERETIKDAQVSKKYDYNTMLTAYITKVYDGDTLTAKFYQFGAANVCQESLRVYGIDTPEIKPKDNKECPYLEKFAANFVRDYVRSLVKRCNKHAYIAIKTDQDKYKRPICDIWLCSPDDNTTINNGCVHLNNHLIEKGYAVPYDGKKKHSWTYDKLLGIIGAEDGFHNINWIKGDKNFMKCFNEVLNYYRDNDMTTLLSLLDEKSKIYIEY